MYRFIKLFKRHDYGTYQTLKRVFDKQFTVTTNKTILPLENDKISAKSVQSPHDADSHYRNKGGKKVKGYSANITETCDDDPKDSEEQPGDRDKAVIVKTFSDTYLTLWNKNCPMTFAKLRNFSHPYNRKRYCYAHPIADCLYSVSHIFLLQLLHQ